MALAALSCPICCHDMLAVSLAAVLGHLDAARFSLKAGKAGPGQKREKGQSNYTDCPEVVFLVMLHLAI